MACELPATGSKIVTGLLELLFQYGYRPVWFTKMCPKPIVNTYKINTNITSLLLCLQACNITGIKHVNLLTILSQANCIPSITSKQDFHKLVIVIVRSTSPLKACDRPFTVMFCCKGSILVDLVSNITNIWQHYPQV